MERRELFVCQCYDVSHQLILETWDDEPVVYGMFHLDNYGFSNRMACAVKYILGIKRKDGDFDALLFNNEDAARLQLFVDVLDDGNCKEMLDFKPVVTEKTELGRDRKDTEYFRWTFGYRSCYGDFDSFEFTPADAPYLRKMIETIK